MAKLLRKNLNQSRSRYYQALLFSILASLLLIAFLISLGLPYYDKMRTKSYFSEVFLAASELRMKLTGKYLETGVWPASLSKGLDTSPDSSAITDFQSDWISIQAIEPGAQGSFDLILSAKIAAPPQNRLSFRVAMTKEQPTTSLIWLCGYAKPPAGFEVTVGNRTNIPPEKLPAICRN